ncbi:hypothetical protein [Cellulomonas sp. URHB0016]
MTGVLLIGLGADIGSNLLHLSATDGVEHPVTDVLTNPIVHDGTSVDVAASLEEAAARLLLANPQLAGRIGVDASDSSVSIDDRRFRIHFQDLEDDLGSIGTFDLAILATSRRHVRSAETLARVQQIARTVVGVAESAALPAVYPALLASSAKHFAAGETEPAGGFAGAYALGSCQCAGWTAGLRVLAEHAESRGALLQDVLVHTEVEIVHPDTASSAFGMKRVGPRTEDPRDNLRPGVSQVAESMRRFGPATSANHVSLRTLVQPPGYQVQRFFVRGIDVDRAGIVAAAQALADAEPAQLRVTASTIGSRAWASVPASTVLLTAEQHLVTHRIGDVTELVMQGYVHNTLGYCAAVLAATDRILRGEPGTVVLPEQPTTSGKD